MAYFQLEPFGDAVADQRHGVAVATMVNMQRPAGSKPCRPEDFITWCGHEAQHDEPTLLADPVAQSNLLRAALFGKAPD
jgi:hypothetical protein